MFNDQVVNYLVLQIWILYNKAAYELEEEIFLYDVSRIIAAVGGSMGLFLGFSCLQARDTPASN